MGEATLRGTNGHFGSRLRVPKVGVLKLAAMGVDGHAGALHWLGAQFRVLQKKVDLLEKEIAHVQKPFGQEGITKHQADMLVEVPGPMAQEKIAHCPTDDPQKQGKQPREEENIVEAPRSKVKEVSVQVPDPMPQGEIVHCQEAVSQRRGAHQHAEEKIMEAHISRVRRMSSQVPGPVAQDVTVHCPKVAPQRRGAQQHLGEKIAEVPIQEKTARMERITQERSIQRSRDDLRGYI